MKRSSSRSASRPEPQLDPAVPRRFQDRVQAIQRERGLTRPEELVESGKFWYSRGERYGDLSSALSSSESRVERCSVVEIQNVLSERTNVTIYSV